MTLKSGRQAVRCLAMVKRFIPKPHSTLPLPLVSLLLSKSYDDAERFDEVTMPVRLFVGNLPYDATEEEIRQHFSSVGNLSYISIPLDRETGKKRGFAFVEFSDAQQAQEAIRQFNNQPFKGR